MLFFALALSLALAPARGSMLPSSQNQPHFAAPWANFTNSSTALTLATPVFTLALSARSGALLALDDAASGERLFYGSAFGQLWALVGPSGSLNNNDASLAFAFAWAAPCLNMTWAAPQPGFRAAVSVCAPAQQRYFDAAFTLLAPPPASTPTAWDSLWFPSMPLFNASRSTVFYPQLPGLMLNSSFFAAGAPANLPYPGSGTFAEFLHINTSMTTGASVSLFTVSGPALTIPHFKGLYPVPAAGAGLWRYAHSIQPVNVTGGCDVYNGGWAGGAAAAPRAASAAPPCALGDRGTVLVRHALQGSVLDDLRLYGAANALQLPPIASKVPAALLRQLGRAPLYKVDAIELGLPFSAYAAQLLPLLPQPGLVHFCAFEPVAFDHFYPDFLPPAARFGSNCDALGAWAAAKAAGHLTMPYTNPSAWPRTARQELACFFLTPPSFLPPPFSSVVGPRQPHARHRSPRRRPAPRRRRHAQRQLPAAVRDLPRHAARHWRCHELGAPLCRGALAAPAVPAAGRRQQRRRLRRAHVVQRHGAGERPNV